MASSEVQGDDSWEDIPSNGFTVSVKNEPDMPTLPSSPTRVSPRKRAPRRQIVASSPRKSRSKPASRMETPIPMSPKLEPEPEPEPNPEPPILTAQEATRGLKHFTVFAFRYLFDVFSFSIYLMKRPLGFILFLWTVSYIVAKLSSTFRAVLSPLVYHSRHFSPPLYSTDAVGGSGVSLEIKRGEMAAADLASLVQFSDLTSKTLLATSLREFVHDAKSTGRGPPTAQLEDRRSGRQYHGRLTTMLFRPLPAVEQEPTALESIVPWIARKRRNQIVTSAFTASMDTMNQELKRLILEAEANLVTLGVLEEKLSNIHELVHREESSVESAKDDLLSQLWTILGGNRRELKGFNDNLRLLKDLSMYRQKARAHVAGALTTLNGMQADMEDLRERVSAPELAGSSIPIQVHMNSIQSGLDRLKQGRIDAKNREQDTLNQILGLAGP
ncbi:hypothetical protein DL96DRAFT_1778824 [Flagelloscypha sp. PMI_526]|nr:hypothetical protein DL96DRAFT_1778824 [Flagelloscypha sp. PMI_526]